MLLIIGCDDRFKPKRSALVAGIETDPVLVRRAYSLARTTGIHADDWPVLLLVNTDSGIESTSIVQAKAKPASANQEPQPTQPKGKLK